MKEPLKLSVGDQIRLKKPHPCGGTDWEILRVGVDFRLQCLTCGHLILIPRLKVEKSLKKVLKSATLDLPELV